jgi:Rad3-related DNA helicase
MPYAYTGDDKRVEFKPAFVGDYCKEAVWRHAKKWLLMSATIISSSSLLRGLGWDGRYQTVAIGSSFPIPNRRVTVRSVADMKRGGGDDELGRLNTTIRDLVGLEPGRCVIHTVSYILAEHICRHLGREVSGPGGAKRVLSYRMAGERATAVAEYLRTPASILVAPSADRGIDLPDELCRLTIIAKVPYPNLGDRMVRMRTYMGHEGQMWYSTTTVRSIVQMAGRGVRHKDDWCRTIILDRQFESGVWLKSKSLFPQWFKEAMVWER